MKKTIQLLIVSSAFIGNIALAEMGYRDLEKTYKQRLYENRALNGMGKRNNQQHLIRRMYPQQLQDPKDVRAKTLNQPYGVLTEQERLLLRENINNPGGIKNINPRQDRIGNQRIRNFGTGTGW